MTHYMQKIKNFRRWSHYVTEIKTAWRLWAYEAFVTVAGVALILAVCFAIAYVFIEYTLPAMGYK